VATSVDLIVNIVTKMSGAGMDQAEKQTSKFKSGLNKASVGAGVALAGIVAFGKGAVDAASDVQQSLGAVDAVFGKNASTIDKWANQASESVGVSKNAYMELATVTGAQLKNMGLPMDMVTGKTGDLIKKGADLAATFGGTTKDAVEAIGSALRGETDPIEKYGVSIKQADIKAQQAAEGTDKLTGAAGKQAKTMALLHLMNKQTADSTGAFAKESDTAAHAAQVSSAQYDDMKAALGEALLPAITKVTSVLGSLAKMMEKHKTTTQVVIVVIAAMAAGIIALNVATTIYTSLTILAGEATVTAWLLSLGPILLVVAAIAAVVAIIIILWKKSETFRTIVLAVWSAIKTAAVATGKALAVVWTKVSAAATKVFAFIKKNWQLMLAALFGPFVLAVVLIIKNWDRIKAAATRTWNAIKAGAAAVKGALIRIWVSIQNVVTNVASRITNAFRNAFATVKSIASSITGAIRSSFEGVKHAVSTAVATAVSVLAGLPGKVKAAFSGAGTLLLSIGSDIVAGLVRGITGAAHTVQTAVNAIISAIPKFIRKKMGIASPSKVMAKIGKDIMRGLSAGMADGVAGVRKVSQLAVDTITKTIGAATKNDKLARNLSRAAIRSIADETSALISNAKKRATVYAGIAKQTAILKDQRAAWDQLKTSVADTAEGFGSFASAAGTTIDDMLSDMSAKVANVQLFQRTMAALARLKLNKDTLSELAQAGPENALARAQALLAGGSAAVSQVNNLQSQLVKAAGTLGSQTADAMYKTGIQAQQALLDGLLADKQRLEKAANQLAKDLAAAVKRALRKYTPSGGKAGKAAPSVASYAAPSLAATPSGRRTAAAGVTNVYVSGAVDPESTARQIQRILDGHDRRVGLRSA